MDVKTAALLETAKAFHARGKFLQYDQRSMDRILQLTPQTPEVPAPEAATEGNTTYLDCSGYVNACFWQTFGVELEADLTWHMIDYVQPRVFYYELTHKETDEEKKRIEAQMRDILLPGDVVTFDRGVGSGYTMLYMGDGLYTDCATNGMPNSYDFENKRSREYENGGIWVHPIAKWFDAEDSRCLFSPNFRRFCIQRPLDVMPQPTANAMARFGAAKDLCCGVEVSHPGGIHALNGENVTYTVFVKNLGQEGKTVSITFDGQSVSDSVAAGERKEWAFCRVAPHALPKAEVNGLEVYVPTVVVDRAKFTGDSAAVAEKILSGMTSTEAACGKTQLRKFYDVFYLHDSTGGDVLSRRPQVPERDGAVYAMYGGVGVVTPEFATKDGIRCMKIRTRDIVAGDVILCCDDAHGTGLYSCFCTGQSLVGQFDCGGEVMTLTGSQMDEFVDSLFGRFCFVVLRPCLEV